MTFEPRLRVSPDREKETLHVREISFESNVLKGQHPKPRYLLQGKLLLPEDPAFFQERNSVAVLAPALWCTMEHRFSKDIAAFLLSKQIAVFMYDNAGLSDPSLGGKSEGKIEAYSLKQMVEDHRNALRTIRTKFKTVYSMGISMGGLSAYYARNEENKEENHPSRVILICPTDDIKRTRNHFLPKLQKEEGILLYPSSAGTKKRVTLGVFDDSLADGYTGYDFTGPGAFEVICAAQDEQIPTMRIFDKISATQIAHLLHNVPHVTATYLRSLVDTSIPNVVALHHGLQNAYEVLGANHNFDNSVEARQNFFSVLGTALHAQ